MSPHFGPISFAIGLVVGSACLLLFLLMLCWGERMAEDASQTPPLDAKRRELVDKLNKRKESPRWTE